MFDAIVGEDSSGSAAGSRWLVGSPFVRLTSDNGYKEADLTFTLFGNAKPTAQQTGDDASDYSGADSNGTVPAGWLHDVKLKAGFSHGDNETSVYGILSAANTTTVWDGATLRYDDGATVVFDADYTLLENNATPMAGSSSVTPHSLPMECK